MAIPSAGVRIECTLQNGAVAALNVWHGITSVSGAPTVAAAQVLVDRLRDFYVAINSQLLIGTNVTIGSKVIAIGQTPNVYVGVTPRTTAGTLAGPALPLQTCLTLKLRTVDATRRGRGHIYLWPFSQSQNPATVPVSTLTAAINTAAAGLPSSPSSATPALAVFSRIGSGTPTAPNPYMTAIDSAVASTTWSVLRSRRR